MHSMPSTNGIKTSHTKKKKIKIRLKSQLIKKTFLSSILNIKSRNY